MQDLASSSAGSRDWASFQAVATEGVTLMKAHFTEHAFERHSHETYSIGLTLSGVQAFHCGGTRHASLRGDVILFNPDQAHDGQRGTHEGFGYAIFYIPTRVMAECRGDGSGGTYFRQPVARDPAMGQALSLAIAAAGQAQESLRAQELTSLALAGLLQRYGERRAQPPLASTGARRMQRIRDYLCTHFDQDIKVETLAQEAGLSRAHLTRAFSLQFGVPPHLYLNAVRLRRAQSAMRDGQSLADVAMACGFADQSHFSRRFKGSVGLSPGAWLRQMQA